MNKYRGRFQIIRDILLVVASEDGSRKTHIMYGANLSYKLLLQYLEEIVKAGLLVCKGESSYWITERGMMFLKIYEEYDRSRKMLDEHINDVEIGENSLKKMLAS